jgi:hypothetical protein
LPCASSGIGLGRFYARCSVFLVSPVPLRPRGKDVVNIDSAAREGRGLLPRRETHTRRASLIPGDTRCARSSPTADDPEAKRGKSAAMREMADLRKERTEHERAKRQRLEMQVAVERGALIRKDLVLQQAGFLLVAMRDALHVSAERVVETASRDQRRAHHG